MLVSQKNNDKHDLIIMITKRIITGVIFDSSLLHKTDTVKFGPGLKRRHVNLVYLFGDKPKMCAQAARKKKALTEAAKLLRKEGTG